MRAISLVGAALLLTACTATRDTVDTVVLVRSLSTSPPEVTVQSATQSHTLTQPLDAVVLTGSQITTMPTTLEKVRDNFLATLDAVPVAARMYTLLFATGAPPPWPPDAEPTISTLLAYVASSPVVEVQITGHTDSIGTLEANDKLAFDRAIAVRDALLARGLRASLVRVVGRGERQPLICTGDEVAEPRNRRVDILVR